jgi:NADH dehydrogenase
VIGAGATGVELAGTLAEIARHTLRGEFRRFDSHAARVVLLKGGELVLAALPRTIYQGAHNDVGRRCRRVTARESV